MMLTSLRLLRLRMLTTSSLKTTSVFILQINILLILIHSLSIEEQDKSTSKSFGSGFDRKVGSKGSQISGGQKQRIAIARALLRNPNIMLFDEATSALDPNTEQVVQEAIDKVMADRTSVTVAHRISTIKNSDEILVFRDGKIIEKGNYGYLNEIHGVFYRLERGILEM